MDPKAQALAFEESKCWRAYSRPGKVADAIEQIAARHGSLKGGLTARRVVAGRKTRITELG